jgi:hypothetical protein
MRCDLQEQKLKKSGKNDYAGYEYFELQDFLPKINNLMLANKVSSRLSFEKDKAVLSLINFEKPEEQIDFYCPMAEANLKGCHPVQNLGASITYIRRYLYTNAFEICEHDMLDSSKPLNGNGDKHQEKHQEKSQEGEEQEARNEITKLLREICDYDDDVVKDKLEEISGFEGTKGYVNGKRSTYELKGKWLFSTLKKVRAAYEQHLEEVGV